MCVCMCACVCGVCGGRGGVRGLDPSNYERPNYPGSYLASTAKHTNHHHMCFAGVGFCR